MPKTRSEATREHKVAEILDASERRLLEGGAESLSVAAIARELGLAQNSIYWYFPTRDHLLVATMERLLAAIVARKPKRQDADEIERVIWFTDQLHELSELRASMRERARGSEVVAEFLSNLDQTLSQMLSNVLRGRVPDDRLPLAVAAFRATVDGVALRDPPASQRRQVLRFALERLIA